MTSGRPGVTVPPLRFLPARPRVPSRSPNRSPTRRAGKSAAIRDVDPLLADLSPTTTLEALTSTYTPSDARGAANPLAQCVFHAMPAERAIAIRAATALKFLRQWHMELSSWDWPVVTDIKAATGFELPAMEERASKRRKMEACRAVDEQALLKPVGADEEHDWDDNEEYWGGAPARLVKQKMDRISAIRDGIEDLEMQELERLVLEAHMISRPKSASAQDARYGMVNEASLTPLDDMTAITTASILQALPHLARTLNLLDTWSARLAVLERVPPFLRLLNSTEDAIRSAWQAIGVTSGATGQDSAPSAAFQLPLIEPDMDSPEPSAPPINPPDTSAATNFNRADFAGIQVVLAKKVATLGQKLDKMLDSLEGREDTIPDSWIDSMERLERDYSDWVCEAERVALQNELRTLRPREPPVGMGAALKQEGSLSSSSVSDDHPSNDVHNLRSPPGEVSSPVIPSTKSSLPLSTDESPQHTQMPFEQAANVPGENAGSIRLPDTSPLEVQYDGPADEAAAEQVLSTVQPLESARDPTTPTSIIIQPVDQKNSAPGASESARGENPPSNLGRPASLDTAVSGNLDDNSQDTANQENAYGENGSEPIQTLPAASDDQGVQSNKRPETIYERDVTLMPSEPSKFPAGLSSETPVDIIDGIDGYHWLHHVQGQPDAAITATERPSSPKNGLIIDPNAEHTGTTSTASQEIRAPNHQAIPAEATSSEHASPAGSEVFSSPSETAPSDNLALRRLSSRASRSMSAGSEAAAIDLAAPPLSDDASVIWPEQCSPKSPPAPLIIEEVAASNKTAAAAGPVSASSLQSDISSPELRDALAAVAYRPVFVDARPATAGALLQQTGVARDVGDNTEQSPRRRRSSATEASPERFRRRSSSLPDQRDEEAPPSASPSASPPVTPPGSNAGSDFWTPKRASVASIASLEAVDRSAIRSIDVRRRSTPGLSRSALLRRTFDASQAASPTPISRSLAADHATYASPDASSVHESPALVKSGEPVGTSVGRDDSESASPPPSRRGDRPRTPLSNVSAQRETSAAEGQSGRRGTLSKKRAKGATPNDSISSSSNNNSNNSSSTANTSANSNGTRKRRGARLEDKISSILTTIPAHIRLTSAAEAESEILARDSGSGRRPRPRRDTPSSSSPAAAAAAAAAAVRAAREDARRAMTPTPSLSEADESYTLAPAKLSSTSSSSSGAAGGAGSGGGGGGGSRADAETPEVKLYHLRRSGADAPIKLFVRLVGANSERVMVRVGGGWADLGDYLRDYALHHGRRSTAAPDGSGVVEVTRLPSSNGTPPPPPPPRPASAASSSSSTPRQGAITPGGDYPGAIARPASSLGRPRPSPSSLAPFSSSSASSSPYASASSSPSLLVRKTRNSFSTTADAVAAAAAARPRTPTYVIRKDGATVLSSSAGGNAATAVTAAAAAAAVDSALSVTSSTTTASASPVSSSSPSVSTTPTSSSVAASRSRASWPPVGGGRGDGSDGSGSSRGGSSGEYLAADDRGIAADTPSSAVPTATSTTTTTATPPPPPPPSSPSLPLLSATAKLPPQQLLHVKKRPAAAAAAASTAGTTTANTGANASDTRKFSSPSVLSVPPSTSLSSLSSSRRSLSFSTTSTAGGAAVRFLRAEQQPLSAEKQAWVDDMVSRVRREASAEAGASSSSFSSSTDRLIGGEPNNGTSSSTGGSISSGSGMNNSLAFGDMGTVGRTRRLYRKDT